MVANYLKYVIRSGVIALIGMNIFLVFILKYGKESGEIEQPEQAIKIINYQQLEEEYQFMFQNQYLDFPLGISLLDLKGDSLALNDILKENIFVLWYPQHDCTLCFQNSLNRFLEIAHKYSNAIILSTNLNIRELFFFKKKYNINIPCYQVKKNSHEYPFKEVISPLFFNLTKDGKITNLWVHNSKFENLEMEYFDMKKRCLQLKIRMDSK